MVPGTFRNSLISPLICGTGCVFGPSTIIPLLSAVFLVSGNPGRSLLPTLSVSFSRKITVYLMNEYILCLMNAASHI